MKLIHLKHVERKNRPKAKKFTDFKKSFFVSLLIRNLIGKLYFLNVKITDLCGANSMIRDCDASTGY